MKKFQYSTLLKCFIFLLQQICIVILVISILLVSVLFDRSMLDLTDLKSKPFIESAYYENMFKDNIKDLLNFTYLREKFETEGTYDPQKQVDILEYMSTGNLTSQTSYDDKVSLTYNLEDLYNWSREPYKQADVNIHTDFYITENNKMFQRQSISLRNGIIWENEKQVKNMQDLEIPIQNMIIENIEHVYGGSYEAVTGTYYSDNDIELIKEEQRLLHSWDNLEEGNETVEESNTEAVNIVDNYEQSSVQEPGNKENNIEEDIENAEILQESMKKVTEGKLYELKGKELSILLAEENMTTLEHEDTDVFIQEDYHPVNSSNNIINLFQNEMISIFDMQELYRALEYTLNNIKEEVSFYKKSLNFFDKNESNFKYYITDTKRKISYTNIMMDNIQGKSLQDYGNENGSYFHYNEDEIRLVTNITGLEDEFYSSMDHILQGKNRVIFVTVDTSFPQKDKFYEAKKEYTMLHPWVKISIYGAIICFLGYLLCFIYLNISTGICGSDDQEQEHVTLYWFDKIKTELMLVIFILLCVVTVFSFSELDTQFNGKEIAGLLFTSGVLAFISNCFIMFFYLSFVRRIKASTMWRDSIVCWLIEGLKSLLRNKKSIKILVFGILQFVIILPILVITLNPFMAILWTVLILILEVSILFRDSIQRNKLMEGIKKIADGDLEYKIDTLELKGENRIFGEAVNTIGEGLYRAIDDNMKNERLKADLITNVSHDIKTPLTSIINYVNLMKREDIQNEQVQGYIEVLDNKSQRLKQLTEDLVEASKVASGNITLQMDRINFVELIHQIGGECGEKFEQKELTTILRLPQKPVVIIADGRRIWRVIENLYNNVAKYAMDHTRVYVDMEVENGFASFSIKNISEQPLNINADELTERFIRGDVSRSTEGSGLGLSIAKSLTELMEGLFDIYLDGDLFKATVTFPLAQELDLSDYNSV